MLKNKMRRLAPRPDFAENQANHGLISDDGTTVQRDDLDCDHAPVFEIGNRCQDKVSHEQELNEPDRVNRFNSCEIQDGFCQNGKTRCHCDKTTVRVQSDDQNATDDHHLTAKMSGQRNNHDKLSGQGHHDGPYDGASGHNVRFTDDNCHFGNEPDASSQAFVKMTPVEDAPFAHENGRSLNPTSYDSISYGPLPRSPLTPKTWQEAEKLAKMLCKAKLVPPGFESPDLCLLAILQGMEMGLPPMTALQRMALVDGKLTIWGDGALALVLKSGLCTSITEWMGLASQDQEQNQKEFGDKEQLKDLTFDPHLQKREDEWVAFCEVRRAGWDRPIRRSFSSQDAKRANLWKKEGPWLDYPKRMLQMRARAFALRDAFADVLGGLYLREEMEAVKSSYSAPRRAVYLANSTPQRGIKNADRGNMHQNLAWNQTSKSEYQPDDGERKTQENQFIRSKIPNNTHPPSYSRPLTDQAIPVHAKPQPVHGKYQIHGQNDLESPFGAKNQAQPSIKTNIDLRGHQPQTNWDDTVRSANPSQLKEARKAETQSAPVHKSIQIQAFKNDPIKAAMVLSDFQKSIKKCTSLKDLETCRLAFEPNFDLFPPDYLDHAAVIYLEQEAEIEAHSDIQTKTSTFKRQKTTKSYRQHLEIRRWKAKYKPFQRKKPKTCASDGLSSEPDLRSEIINTITPNTSDPTQD